jgi:hypothetical protein
MVESLLLTSAWEAGLSVPHQHLRTRAVGGARGLGEMRALNIYRRMN